MAKTAAARGVGGWRAGAVAMRPRSGTPACSPAPALAQAAAPLTCRVYLPVRQLQRRQLSQGKGGHHIQRRYHVQGWQGAARQRALLAPLPPRLAAAVARPRVRRHEHAAALRQQRVHRLRVHHFRTGGLQARLGRRRGRARAAAAEATLLLRLRLRLLLRLALLPGKLPGARALRLLHVLRRRDSDGDSATDVVPATSLRLKFRVAGVLPAPLPFLRSGQGKAAACRPAPATTQHLGVSTAHRAPRHPVRAARNCSARRSAHDSAAAPPTCTHEPPVSPLSGTSSSFPAASATRARRFRRHHTPAAAAASTTTTAAAADTAATAAVGKPLLPAGDGVGASHWLALLGSGAVHSTPPAWHSRKRDPSGSAVHIPGLPGCMSTR